MGLAKLAIAVSQGIYAQDVGGLETDAMTGVGETAMAEIPSISKEAEPAPAEGAGEIAEDTSASKFLLNCAGCHRLEGCEMDGPALNKAAGWRMQSWR